MRRFTVLLLGGCLVLSMVGGDARAAVDCGPGFVSASVRNREGIQTFECRRLWCRDLENGRVAGRDNNPNNGYVATDVPERIEDNDRNHIYCFGRRRWCDNQNQGDFMPEYGFYVRRGDNSLAHRGVLRGNCYDWGLTAHTCGPGETAIPTETGWVCVVAGSVGGTAARSAIRAQTIRRSSVPVMRR